MHEPTREPGIIAQTAAAFLTSAAAVAGTLIVFELRDPSSRTRLLLDELRERAQEAWIRFVVNDLIEGSD